MVFGESSGRWRLRQAGYLPRIAVHQSLKAEVNVEKLFFFFVTDASANSA
jgi:hypothetical protein